MVSDTVMVAMVGGAVSLLLVFANAVAKRLSTSTAESPPSVSELEDHTVSDIARTTRSLGETLHDETRAMIRRGFSNLEQRLDEIERRMDTAERHRRDDMNEWRGFMKPASFAPLVEQLDRTRDRG